MLSIQIFYTYFVLISIISCAYRNSIYKFACVFVCVFVFHLPPPLSLSLSLSLSLGSNHGNCKAPFFPHTVDA